MTKKKFWVHYSKGDVPKRRSMELTPLAELLPRMNIKCATPLWYIKGEKDPSCSWITYYIYAQLNDTVAIYTTYNLTDYNVEEALLTDEQIKHWIDNKWRGDLERARTPGSYKAVLARKEENRLARIESRERWYKNLLIFSDFHFFMLSQAVWVTEFTLRAYEEINSPLLSTLQALRRAFEKQREEKHKRYLKEEEQRIKEEYRKKKETERHEQERLTEQAAKFKKGEFILGGDVVELCRRYGINVHLRTVHNLQQVVTNIRGKDVCCNYHCPSGKRTPKLDGCFKTAKTLYEYLQNHEDLKAV